MAEKIRRGDQVSGWRLEKWLYKKGASSQCSTYYAEIFAQLKKPCPAELLAPLRVARDRLLNAVRFASSNIRRRRLSGVSGLLRAAVRNRVERDGKFLAAGLTSGWTFERGRWGIFEKRHKRGIVVIKRPNEAFCRENGFVASQQYLGGLRWNREYNVGLRDDLRIIRCR